MQDAWIIGVGSTAFGRWPDRSYEELTDEAVAGAMADAVVPLGDALGFVGFASCAARMAGQANISGQVMLAPAIAAGRLPAGVPIVNVESGCASGSMAFHAAVSQVRLGACEAALAVGVDKTFLPDSPAQIFDLFASGADCMHRDRYMGELRAAAAAAAVDFAPRADRIVFLDIYAMKAAHHMAVYGTTAEQIAAGASKNHAHGALNTKAQYRKAMSIDEVMADKSVVGVLTRSMCAPLSDGAAAAVICSTPMARRFQQQTGRKAVRVCASVLGSGSYRGWSDPSVTQRLAPRAFSEAALGPESIDVVEVHDSTSFCEVEHLEALGLYVAGEAAPAIERGETSLGGRLPVNLSGGLVSKGHPLAATGLSMVESLVEQLRGEAGPRQSSAPRFGLMQNAGGSLGLDEAACGIQIFEAATL